MKKNFGLFFSLFALICNFVCFWYNDALFNRFFIFGLIPLLGAVVILIASLVISIIYLVRHLKNMRSYITLAIVILTIVLIFVFPFRMAKVKTEVYLFENKRLEVIEMVKNGDIVTDDIGNAELPDEYGYLSSDGNIFVYQNDEEQVVSFWVFRGMLSGSVQLIFSSGDDKLIYVNETGHSITDVEKLKEHWYLVNTDY